MNARCPVTGEQDHSLPLSLSLARSPSGRLNYNESTGMLLVNQRQKALNRRPERDVRAHPFLIGFGQTIIFKIGHCIK